MNTKSQYRKNVSSTVSHQVKETIAPVLPSVSFIEIVEQVAQKFVASLNESAKQAFNGRLDRGLELAKLGYVSAANDTIHPRRFVVRSSDGSKDYLVDLGARTCDCPDSLKGNTCKHRVAAYYFEQASKMNTPKKPAPITPPAKPAPVIEAPKPIIVQPQTVPASDDVTSKPNGQPSQPAQPTKKTEEEILKELGFASEPSKPVDTKKVREPGYTLGSLYRRYLHGSDLAGEFFTITIQDITKEKVMPHPSQPAVEKWCLSVTGLPLGMPSRILFGAKGEEDLVAIFGNVPIKSIKGKQVVIYPKAMNVAGQQKISIRFRDVK